MNIPTNQIKYRKRIGHVGSKGVFELGVLGGLVLVTQQEASGKQKVLGTGSHRRLARFLAKKYEPELQIDLLEKSEEGNIEDFKEFIPFWEAVSNRLRG